MAAASHRDVLTICLAVVGIIVVFDVEILSNRYVDVDPITSNRVD